MISRKEAELFYKEHRNKFFYNRLLTFMCSGPSDIHILGRHDAIAKWRQLMGPTKVYQAQYNAQDTIRGMFGLSDTRNATHGSGNQPQYRTYSMECIVLKKRLMLFALDSAESAEREIMIFFKDFNIKKWYDNEEMFYNLGRLHFDPMSFMHTIDKTYIQNKRVTE